MPYKLRKARNKPCYQVYKPKSKKNPIRLFSKCASKQNATKQLRLLRAIQYNKDFVPYAQRRRTRKLRKTRKFHVFE